MLSLGLALMLSLGLGVSPGLGVKLWSGSHG